MTDFEMRKKKYLDELEENEEFLESYKAKNSSVEILEVIVDPKNERQLETAELALLIFNDTQKLLTYALEDELKPIPIEENVALEVVANLVNKMEKQEEILNEIEKFKDPKFAALYVYHLTVGLLTDFEELTDALQERVNIDINSPVQGMRFRLLMDKAGKIANPDQTIKADISDEELEYLKNYAREYEKLTSQGILSKEPETDIHKEHTKDDDSLY